MNLKKTLKKVYKAGMFHSFELTKKTLLFKDCFDNVYSLFPYNNFFMFRIGHVETWKETKPTYESEYNSLGLVDCAYFVDHIKPQITNNPDFIYRVALENLLGPI
jgi:hypothetical protein